VETSIKSIVCWLRQSEKVKTNSEKLWFSHYKLGAYGEVRRALHKKTNVLRAVKIIYKDASDKEDHDRLINEVNILRGLVI